MTDGSWSASGTVSAGVLLATARSILQAAGAPEGAAATVAESLVESDLAGHDSHGVRRLIPYVDAVEAGLIRTAAAPEVTTRDGAMAIVAGRRGFGQLAARLAVDEVAALAARHRVGVAAIQECNHIGRLGEYVATLAGRGLVGMAFGNADPSVAPYGGRERRLGTNPLAWAVPRAEGKPPVVMDWASSAMAEGKLAVAVARGETVPEGVVVDRDGNPTVDPADFYQGGALLPFGGHKGYGLSVMIELVAGLLSGTGVSSLPGYDGTFGTVLLAVDIGAFVPVDRFRAQTEEFCRSLQETPPARGAGGVLVPGEPEARARRERLAHGVPVPAAIWAELRALEARLNNDRGPDNAKEASHVRVDRSPQAPGREP
jgi:LDH2 family malate/lactate/ureidoglycolate dehydrogenase